MILESNGYADKCLFRVHKIAVKKTILYDKPVRRTKYFVGYALS
jgi:hypothetical protein